MKYVHTIDQAIKATIKLDDERCALDVEAIARRAELDAMMRAVRKSVQTAL
jgi:hypothetical protein